MFFKAKALRRSVVVTSIWVILILILVSYLNVFRNARKNLEMIRPVSANLNSYCSSSIPQQQQQVETGKIPKLIWTYWNSDNLPIVMEAFINNRREMNPKHCVYLVNPSSVTLYVTRRPLPNNFNRLTPQGQADWVRLALLVEHGGFWIDSSTILTQPLNWIHDIQQQNGNDGLLFKLEVDGDGDDSYPFIENWFFASVKESEFMRKWMDGFHEVVENFDNDGARRADYLKQRYGEGEYRNITHGLSGWWVTYLTQHVEVQRIMQIDRVVPNFTILDAGDYAYKLAIGEDWNDARIATALLSDTDSLPYFAAPKEISPIIKVNGNQRKFLEMLLDAGVSIHKNSIIARYLHITKYYSELHFFDWISNIISYYSYLYRKNNSS